MKPAEFWNKFWKCIGEAVFAFLPNILANLKILFQSGVLWSLCETLKKHQICKK